MLRFGHPFWAILMCLVYDFRYSYVYFTYFIATTLVLSIQRCGSVAGHIERMEANTAAEK
uniref:Uncharacterized protein n=1 Tax=Megaselia scalaris TaxID=36166 RepID=T1GF94_MEGSC